MGRRSFVTEIKTKNQYMGMLLMKEALADSLGFDPLFDIDCAYIKEKRLFLGISYDCSTLGAFDANLFITKAFKFEFFIELEHLQTINVGDGYIVKKAVYLREIELWDLLRD